MVSHADSSGGLSDTLSVTNSARDYAKAIHSTLSKRLENTGGGTGVSSSTSLFPYSLKSKATERCPVTVPTAVGEGCAHDKEGAGVPTAAAVVNVRCKLRLVRSNDETQLYVGSGPTFVQFSRV